MCIHLSGTCEIDVFIWLPQDSWQKASSLILPESKRIRSLYLVAEVPSARKVLEDFGEMPALKELYLHSRSNSSGAHGENDLEALGLRRMPALRILGGQRISIESKSWRHLITADRINMVDLTKATIERYGKLPNFHDVMIQHRETPGCQGIVDPELDSRALDSSFSRVRSLTCRVTAFNRIVRWFGQNLTRLDVDAPEIDSIQELALSLAVFPGLNSLTISISNELFTNKNHIVVTPLTSITGLELQFLYYKGDDAQQNWEDNANVDFIYEACFKYIESLADLSRLDIEYCRLSRNYSVSLVAKNLSRLSWRVEGYCPTILTNINAPALRNLYIHGTYDGSAHDSLTVSGTIDERSISAYYAISGERLARITSLSLGIAGPVRWELASLPTLKSLRLMSLAPGLMICASDIIEGILMRPCDLPALDTISLPANFVEWDILLLMLERRILYSHFGISPIAVIIVRNRLPYKLLQPISTLLQGKLPEREPNDQFSLESAAERLCNAEIAGCRACCYAFKHCDMLTIPGANTSGFEERITLLSLEYELPSEFLTADPPLTPDVAAWLSGKRARRRAFVQERNRVTKLFHRVMECDHSDSLGAAYRITGYSLDGVTFEESLESSVD